MKPTQTATDPPTDQVPRLVSRSIFVRDFAEPDDGDVEYAGLFTFEAAGRRWVTDRYLVMDDAALSRNRGGLVVTEIPAGESHVRLMGELLASEPGAVTGVFQPHYLGELALAGVSLHGARTGGAYDAHPLWRGRQVVGGLMPVQAGVGLRAVPAVLVAAESRLRDECPWLTARGRWLAAASSLHLLVPVDGWS